MVAEVSYWEMEASHWRSKFKEERATVLMQEHEIEHLRKSIAALQEEIQTLKS